MDISFNDQPNQKRHVSSHLLPSCAFFPQVSFPRFICRPTTGPIAANFHKPACAKGERALTEAVDYVARVESLTELEDSINRKREIDLPPNR